MSDLTSERMKVTVGCQALVLPQTDTAPDNHALRHVSTLE